MAKDLAAVRPGVKMECWAVALIFRIAHVKEKPSRCDQHGQRQVQMLLLPSRCCPTTSKTPTITMNCMTMSCVVCLLGDSTLHATVLHATVFYATVLHATVFSVNDWDPTAGGIDVILSSKVDNTHHLPMNNGLGLLCFARPGRLQEMSKRDPQKAT